MTEDQRDLLEARWRVGEITTDDLHQVADGLLSAGEEGDALVRLFSLDRDELRWEGEAAFDALLDTWGGGEMAQRDAVDVVLRDIATSVLAERITPLEATERAETINVRTMHDHYAALGPWCDLHEELSDLDRSGRSYLGRDQATIEAEVVALARIAVG